MTMSKQNENRIRHLAEQLQHWVWQKVGEKSPSVEDFEKFIASHMDSLGQVIGNDDMHLESVHLPALLKPAPKVSDQAKRMRELAGIPHKGNFV
jgi:hypothetical protein